MMDLKFPRLRPPDAAALAASDTHLAHTHTNSLLWCVRCREVEFIQKEDAERRRLEEAEKAHLAEIQGLQVRVRQTLLSLEISNNQLERALSSCLGVRQES